LTIPRFSVAVDIADAGGRSTPPCLTTFRAANTIISFATRQIRNFFYTNPVLLPVGWPIDHVIPRSVRGISCKAHAGNILKRVCSTITSIAVIIAADTLPALYRFRIRAFVSLMTLMTLVPLITEALIALITLVPLITLITLITLVPLITLITLIPLIALVPLIPLITLRTSISLVTLSA